MDIVEILLVQWYEQIFIINNSTSENLDFDSQQKHIIQNIEENNYQRFAYLKSIQDEFKIFLFCNKIDKIKKTYGHFKYKLIMSILKIDFKL